MADPKPGSKEWQDQLNEEIADHDREVQGTSEGQDFEITPKDG